MSDGARDGREFTDGAGLPGDGEIEAALRRAAGEALPREAFRLRLREEFVAGTLAPAAAEGPAPAPAPRVLPVPRWLAYPAAAAVLAGVLALSGALDPRAVPEVPGAMPPALSAAETALLAAERRVRSLPGLAGLRFEHRVVEGRPVLLPAGAAVADGGELRVLALYNAGAESLLAHELPEVAGRTPFPTVTVVAPSREVFEDIVAPRVAPLGLGPSTVACALAPEDVLLLSPGALAEDGHAHDEMAVARESIHAWLAARGGGRSAVPLWAVEGLAGTVSQSGSFDTKSWCRRLLVEARSAGVDPIGAEDLLQLGSLREMARAVAARAPSEQRPYSLVPVFHAHAESLVMFLMEEHPGCYHRAAFREWLDRSLAGEAMDAVETAAFLGFAGPEDLLAARDAWLGL